MALVEPDVRLTLAPREELVFREAGERGLDLLQELGADALSLELWMDDQPSDGARVVCGLGPYGADDPLARHGLEDHRAGKLLAQRLDRLRERRQRTVAVKFGLTLVGELLQPEDLPSIVNGGAGDRDHALETTR